MYNKEFVTSDQSNRIYSKDKCKVLFEEKVWTENIDTWSLVPHLGEIQHHVLKVIVEIITQFPLDGSRQNLNH